MGTLSLLVFLRVLGVFLVLDGFLEYWAKLGGSAGTVGVGFAAYALALALFLVPVGWLSDHLGRRRVMAWALVVSAAGGLLAAAAPSAWLFALGRFVQGMGAVNGVALAVAGELGDPDRRTRRMAVLGAAAGGGVVLGLLASAGLHAVGVGIPQLLVAFSVLTLLTIPLVLATVPKTGGAPPEPIGPRSLRAALLVGSGAFAVNFSLAALLLFSRPLLAAAAPGVPYVLALLAMIVPGGLGMFVTSRLADQGHARAVGVGAAALLGLAPLAFLGRSGAPLAILAGVAFFLAHASLSSLLPALASSLAPAGRRGLAQGIQSALQYFGSAAGPALVGALYAGGLAVAMGGAFLASGALVAGVVAAATAGREPSEAPAAATS